MTWIRVNRRIMSILVGRDPDVCLWSLQPLRHQWQSWWVLWWRRRGGREPSRTEAPCDARYRKDRRMADRFTTVPLTAAAIRPVMLDILHRPLPPLQRWCCPLRPGIKKHHEKRNFDRNLIKCLII